MDRRLSEHPAMNEHRTYRPRARYRVYKNAWFGWWCIEDRETDMRTVGGHTWQDAINQVRARYDRLQRAHDYMTHFHPDQIDADEIIYSPGNWANG